MVDIDSNETKNKEFKDVSYELVKVRVGMLATAIGGPDHSADVRNPPYKIGDDCLACLKDLIRWFKLVDDNQRRWDVAMAAAEYRILENDLIPLLLDWEAKYSFAHKKSKKSGENISNYFKNKNYYDRIAIGALQIIVLMTWPLILTDQSTPNQINHYFELKKHQLLYKHAILSTEGGKVLKAAIRVAVNIMNMDKLDRSARDQSLVRMVIHFLKNITAIEPGEVTISNLKRLKRPLTIQEMLPTNVTLDDISINNVLTAFENNKVFPFILTICSCFKDDFDESFLNLPLLELMFFITKDISASVLFHSKVKAYKVGTNHEIFSSKLTRSGKELTLLLSKEHEKKKEVIRHTSSRHSRFGGLLSIRTPNNTRLTVPSSSVTIEDDAALQELDSRKKWNKSSRMKLDVIEGLSSNFLDDNTNVHLSEKNLESFKSFLSNFTDSSFNELLHRITDTFTSDIQDQISLHKIEYTLFVAWFMKFQRLRCGEDEVLEFNSVSEVLTDTCLILISKYLREAFESKNWPVVHSSMIVFTEYFVSLRFLDDSWQNDINFVLEKILSENMLQIFCSIPKIASNHSSKFIRDCILLTNSVLRLVEKCEKNETLIVEAKKRSRKRSLKHSEVEQYAKENGLEYEDAFDILEDEFKHVSISLEKIFRGYCVESTVSTYIKYLNLYKELEDEDLVIILKFLHRLFVKSKNEVLLFRIDFLILLKEMLSSGGLATASKVREDFTDFSKYILQKLKRKLERSPSWYVNILFPLLHESTISHYMKYDTVMEKVDSNRIVEPNKFVNIENEQNLNAEILEDTKFGIVVSCLLDEGYDELVDSLVYNLKKALTNFHSWLARELALNEKESLPFNEHFEIQSEEIKRSMFSNANFRLLLLLCGYKIPTVEQSSCYLDGGRQIERISKDIELIEKYRTSPFKSTSGKPASYYLTALFDDKQNMSDYHSDPENDNYFQGLDAMEARLQGKIVSVGKATSKKRRSKPKSKDFDARSQNGNDLQLETGKSGKQNIISKEYIIDSEDDDDTNILGSIFFENEMFLRYLLDKNNGSLTSDQYKKFGEFSEERMRNHGALPNNYTELFGGLIPDIKLLEDREDNRNSQTNYGDLTTNMPNEAPISSDENLSDTPYESEDEAKQPPVKRPRNMIQVGIYDDEDD